MNTLEFEKFGVQGLDAREMANVDGGWILGAITIAGAVIYLYNEGGDFIKGFNEGYNHK